MAASPSGAGDVDQGKMSIIGGAIIAAAPAVVYAFYTIFGLNTKQRGRRRLVLNRPNPIHPIRHERQFRNSASPTPTPRPIPRVAPGLEGGLFWWLTAASGRASSSFCPARDADVSLGMSFLAALVPVSLCLAYIFGLRQGKPPGYDRTF